ncbi:hypothetical protein [Erythrobacter rubeus]|uniref:Lipoprotein n=1 Tax=Erythrobacter rubeus TaxID=2760803 RepID=A0ABR8KQA5_9SPHN|nr:hypothetical protein [Erythrobacter rubeus]MBD2842931.1 hypothetical protein [Erythrobacter rubeus]
MINRHFALSTVVPALILTGCAETAADEPQPDRPPSAQDEFWDALSSHCGKAYRGSLVSTDEADADFAGADMVMHVRECSEDRIAVPFHVELNGEWDRSRTWVITRTGDGLRLKHDHRHEDGESDAVTMYGGDTASDGTAHAQDFPVDAESVALFRAEDLTASVTNVWRVEVDPAGTEDGVFAFQLQRTVDGGAPGPRFFRVEYDLTDEVAPPPPAWGHE